VYVGARTVLTMLMSSNLMCVTNRAFLGAERFVYFMSAFIFANIAHRQNVGITEMKYQGSDNVANRMR
jgi:hypothetical protein